MANKQNNDQDDQSLVISYLTLRKAIGIFGLLFPLVLAVGAYVLFSAGIQRSVSSYYHTGMRDVFVGTLCVIGFFLFSYKGYEHKDDLAGDLGCVFALGMALFPTTPEPPVPAGAAFIGAVHLTFAALFFLVLIYFCLVLFVKTSPDKPMTFRKTVRNNIYRGCGYTMLACIVLITAYHLVPADLVSGLRPYDPVFWLETVAVEAFGISWLIKGQAILGDL